MSVMEFKPANPKQKPPNRSTTAYCYSVTADILEIYVFLYHIVTQTRLEGSAQRAIAGTVTQTLQMAGTLLIIWTSRVPMHIVAMEKVLKLSTLNSLIVVGMNYH